jgi:hypothetical protein
MAGAAARYVYTSDDGTDYAVRMPTWEATLQSASAATTEAPLPKGYQRRKRYYRLTASGREGSVTVCDSTNGIYTADFGTGVIIPTWATATPGSNNATWEGRTGEKSKHI